MRDVVGYEGLYKVTSCGKVWSCRQEKFLKPAGGEDYQMVCLRDREGKQHYDYVHRMVAKAYIPNPDNLPQVNHKDEVKYHNWVNNLEWCDSRYNNTYGTRNKRAGKNIHGPIAVYCVELDRRFESAAAAARFAGVHPTAITACIHERQLTAGGYHWKKI